MIIENGYIEPKIGVGGGGFDENHNPIPPTTIWGDLIKVQSKINKLNYLGISEGERFTRASYEILVEYDATLIPILTGGIVRFNGAREYSVLSVEPLPIVQLIRILI